jgi:hypothetical protein
LSMGVCAMPKRMAVVETQMVGGLDRVEGRAQDRRAATLAADHLRLDHRHALWHRTNSH